MNKKRKKIFLSILATFFFICIAGAGTVYYYLFYPQFHPSKTTYIYIDRDDTTDSIFNKIKKQGNPHSFNGFKWMSHFREYSKISIPDVTPSTPEITLINYTVDYQEAIKLLST